MADQGTRVRAGKVGQASGFKLLRINLAAEEAAIRADFLTKAAEKLGVSLPDDTGAVCLFLADGAPVDEMRMLEKDDTIWLALDGGAWREPGVHARAEGSSESPAETAEKTMVMARSQQSKTLKPQASIGGFFGSGVKRTLLQTPSAPRRSIGVENPPAAGADLPAPAVADPPVSAVADPSVTVVADPPAAAAYSQGAAIADLPAATVANPPAAAVANPPVAAVADPPAPVVAASPAALAVPPVAAVADLPAAPVFVRAPSPPAEPPAAQTPAVCSTDGVSDVQSTPLLGSDTVRSDVDVSQPSSRAVSPRKPLFLDFFPVAFALDDKRHETLKATILKVIICVAIAIHTCIRTCTHAYIRTFSR